MTHKIVLLDNSYFNFYRYFATNKWWLFQNSGEVDINNPKYMNALNDQYIKNLTKLGKIIGVNYRNFYSIRDSDRETLWRTDIYPDYKSNRDFSGEPHEVNKTRTDIFRHFNSTFGPLFAASIRISKMEADDIIAILTKIFIDLNFEVIIISADNDFLQLYEYSGVTIIDAKGLIKEKLSVSGARRHLDQKILKGDPSDNISKSVYPWKDDSEDGGKIAWKYITNSILIDFDYIPRIYQNHVVIALQNSGIIKISELQQDYNPKNIQLGLCCINNSIDACCSKKPIIATIEKKGLEYLYEIVEQNIINLVKMIEWNHINGLRVLRISSGLVPHKSNKRVSFGSLNRFQHLFDIVGFTARRYKHRLTFHPGQYNVVGSPNMAAFDATYWDLDYHAEVLDRIGCDQDGIMVVHGGGLYGESMENNIKRWVDGFRKLSERSRRRLVLENDEKSYNIEDCLAISKLTGVPVVFDTHHHECYMKIHPNSGLLDGSEYIARVLDTWGTIKPKFHVSEQGEGKCGKHSDYIENLPNYILQIPAKYGVQIDIMIEAKKKELAIQKLYEKYDCINPFIIDNHGPTE